MLGNGQTLRHKEREELARLDPPTPGESWAWDIGPNTAFIAEDGSKFIDDISNWTHVEDELGRPYAKQPAKGQFVDESAKKYFVSEEELAQMREKKLGEWEAEILDRMKNGGTPPTIKYIEGIKTTCYGHGSYDNAGKSVQGPFTWRGYQSLLFQNWFLKRRQAIPLYRSWNSIRKEYMDGPMVFQHADGQLWMYERHLSRLAVIEEGSIAGFLAL